MLPKKHDMGEKCINVVIGNPNPATDDSLSGDCVPDMTSLKRGDPYRYWVYRRVCELLHPVGVYFAGMRVLHPFDAARTMALGFRVCIVNGPSREVLETFWNSRMSSMTSYVHSASLDTTFYPAHVVVTVHDRFPRSTSPANDRVPDMLAAGDELMHLQQFFALVEAHYTNQVFARLTFTPSGAHLVQFFHRDWPDSVRTAPVAVELVHHRLQTGNVQVIQDGSWVAYRYCIEGASSSRVMSDARRRRHEEINARRPGIGREHETARQSNPMTRERPSLGAIYVASEPTPSERAEVLILLKRVTDAQLMDDDTLDAYLDAVIGDEAGCKPGESVHVGQAVARCTKRATLVALIEFLKAALFLGGHVLDAETLRMRIVRRFMVIQSVAKAFDPECATLCGYICVALQVDVARMPAHIDKAETRLLWALELCQEPHRLFGVLRYLDELTPPPPPEKK